MSKFNEWFDIDEHDWYNYPEEMAEDCFNAGVKSVEQQLLERDEQIEFWREKYMLKQAESMAAIEDIIAHYKGSVKGDV